MMEMKQVRLEGRFVALEPMEERHREELRGAAGDGSSSWPYIPIKGRYDDWVSDSIAAKEKVEALPYVVRRLEDGKLVGSTRYLNLSPKDRRLEIGSTWYDRSVWAGQVNPECKLLLIGQAFDTWGANRVELRCDGRNARSRAAIARLGATEEAVLRRHMYAPDGFLRDTVVFAIMPEDWTAVRAGLEARLRQS